MNKEKLKNVIAISIISLLVLGVVGVSYAYFRLQIEGSGNDIVLDTGDLRLRYTDGKEITLSNAMPGDSVSKTVTVENIGTRDVTYQLNWSDLINTIQNYEIHVTLECKSYTGYGTSNQAESGECNRIYRAVPISDISTSALIKNNISIKAGITHEYNITVTFDDKDYDQSSNMKKSFTGKVDIQEYNAPKPVYCTYDGTPSNGTTYVNGIYTYTYNSTSKTWRVQLTDKDSTDPITEAPCTFVNQIPIISMSNMFSDSKSTSIDVSSFNTSNIIYMNSMFYGSTATEIKGLENFDTSNVTDMSSMFKNSKTSLLNLSNLDTSKVTNMYMMFYGSTASSLDVSSFDTSKVTSMEYMFDGAKATEIKGLENFDTSNVKYMGFMFVDLKVSVLNVSSFDTSNVTNMALMFAGAAVNEIKGLENFDTSKVTNMNRMFDECTAEILDVSSFDTSNLTSMNAMFSRTVATEIKGIENFDTSNVTNMGLMFNDSKVTELNLSNFDTSKVISMSYMFNGCSAIESLDVSSFNTSNVTNMNMMFSSCNKLKTIYVSDNFVTDSVTSTADLFFNDYALIGGNGTKFASNRTSITYARIDTADTPGYFTKK